MSSVGVTAESLLSADEAELNLFSFSKLVGAGRDCCWGAAIAAIASLGLKSHEEREIWQHRLSGELERDMLEGDMLEGGKLEGDKLEGDKLEGDKLEGNTLEGDKLEETY